ncbi:hypothetical protein Tco_1322362 [Tanacetum coccineum]
MESLDSNSQQRELHQLQQMQDKAKESCLVSFRLLHSHLKVFSNNDLKGARVKGEFERAFVTLFDQDVQTFTGTMLLNLDQLEEQLDKEKFQENRSFDAFRSINERAQHKREYDRRVNKRQMQTKEGNVDMGITLDVGLIVIENKRTKSDKQDSRNRSGNYSTHVVDADIRPVNDQLPLVQSPKTRNSNKPIEQKSHTQTPVWQILTGYRFSSNKSFAMYEKISPRDISKPVEQKSHPLRLEFSTLLVLVMASKQSSSGPALHEMNPGTLSSRLVPQPPSPTPFVPPTRNDWDTLFQPLFDEYFSPPPCVDHPVP